MIQGRREFLSLAGYTFLFSGLPSLVWSKLNRKILILVELQGANDGLNTVIPLNQKYYYRLRPNIGIEKSKILDITRDNGLHFSLKNVAKNFEKGNNEYFIFFHNLECHSFPPEYQNSGVLKKKILKFFLKSF